MKMKLHRPKKNLWIISMILFVLGIVGFFVSIPVLSTAAFYLVAISAVFLLLGTWLF